VGEYGVDKQQWKKNLIQSRTLMEMLQNSIKGNFAYPAKKVYSRVMQKYPLTVLIYLDVFLQYTRGLVLIKLSIGTLIATIPI